MTRPQPVRRERIGRPLKDHDPETTPLAPRFDEYLWAKRRSINETTRKDYQYGFDLFARWLRGCGLPVTVASFEVARIEAYVDHLRERRALPGKRPFDGAHLSTHSQNAYLRPLNQFGDYLAWEGWLPVNPFLQTYDSLMPALDSLQRVLKLATPDDIRALVAATAGDDPLALRDRALLAVGWETGMRTQDLCGLDLDDVELRTGILTIRGAKGDRDRQVKLGLALPLLARYLGIGRPRQVELGAHRLPGAGPSALFLSDAVGGARNRSGRLTTNGVYELLTERWHQAGRTGHFGAHRLRHGLATLLVEANVSLAIVAAWLGHSLETTTMLYAHPTVGAMHRHVGPVVADSLRGAGLDELGAA